MRLGWPAGSCLFVGNGPRFSKEAFLSHPRQPLPRPQLSYPRVASGKDLGRSERDRLRRRGHRLFLTSRSPSLKMGPVHSRRATERSHADDGTCHHGTSRGARAHRGASVSAPSPLKEGCLPSGDENRRLLGTSKEPDALHLFYRHELMSSLSTPTSGRLQAQRC